MSSRRGVIDLDEPFWHVVRNLYYEDKVVEAMKEAENLGGRDSNEIYAEARVRAEGTQTKLRPWLTFEAIEPELPVHLSEITNVVATECENLSKHFGWDNSEATMVTLLPREVEASWMPGRWGYFVDKVPHDKVCLPFHDIASPQAFVRTLKHEFMHDITLNLSKGRASRWVEEAMSTYAEGRRDPQALQGFQSGQLTWLSPSHLDATLATDNRRADKQGNIWAAYSQANLICRFLVKNFGEPEVGKFLRALGDTSLWESLKDSLLSRTPVDSALHHVYGLSEQQVFAKAHEWVAAGPRSG